MNAVDGTLNLGNCANCPNVMHQLQFADFLEEQAGQEANMAMDAPYSDMGQSILAQIREKLGEDKLFGLNMGAPINSAEDLAEQLQAFATRSVEEKFEQAEELREQAQAVTVGCEGPFKLRAVRLGRTIVVTVCATPLMPDGESCEQTHMTRSTPPTDSPRNPDGSWPMPGPAEA